MVDVIIRNLKQNEFQKRICAPFADGAHCQDTGRTARGTTFEV
jgi:hypothetical protein